MTDVFISYKREERPEAQAIAAAVASRGYEVWWDVELLPGDEFADEIEAIIQKAKAAVVLWSEKSVRSDFVRAEASLALKKGILIPVRLDNATIPLPFGNRHTLDLGGWDGSPTDPKLAPLLAAIAKRIDRKPTDVVEHEQIEAVLKKPSVEVDYWKSISTSQNIEEFQAYLKRFGEEGAFSDIARIRIEKLRFEKGKKWPKVAQVIAGVAAVVGLAAMIVGLAKQLEIASVVIGGAQQIGFLSKVDQKAQSPRTQRNGIRPTPDGDVRLQLARLIYGEARTDGPRGMEAVAHVVLNRMRTGTYPNDVLGAVRE
jgi:hypothetical protein